MNLRSVLLFAACAALVAANLYSAEPAGTKKLSEVYFTHDISPEGLMKAYKALGRPLEGKNVAVKISTGEAGNNHYLQPSLIGPFVKSLKGDIVECNTAYAGSRMKTKDHRETIEDHGFNAIAKVVIMDEFAETELPTPKGSVHLKSDLVGAALTNYDGFVILNHFKGHQMGGFGGALKNLSIGCASSRGKSRIHTANRTDDLDKMWSKIGETPQKDFIESMAEAAGAIVDFMGDRAVYISVMNNISIDCDCNGHPAKPEMADVGILASLDPVALDKACVDLVYASDPEKSASLRARMEKQLGPHILDHAESLGYGTKSYKLISLDNNEPPSTKRMELTALEVSLANIGASLARGEQDKLRSDFEAAFKEGLTLNQAKEIVGQLYAYCGFPRALNAAQTLMILAKEIAAAGEPVKEGRAPGALPEGKSLVFGTENQTKLCGGPVKGELFDFHPQLDEYLKAHLFGDIFARDNLDWRTRELVTIAALSARPETEPQLKAHVAIGLKNGLTKEQAEEIVALAQRPADPKDLPADWSPIPVGEPNTAYAQYFIGRSYLHPLTLQQVPAFGVTFEPSCRNNWHIHHAKAGGGQILIVTAGEGYYQEWGKEARKLSKGDTVNIPAGVKHWHGAAPGSWFQHIALEVPGEGNSNEWLEPVDDSTYLKATTENEEKEVKNGIAVVYYSWSPDGNTRFAAETIAKKVGADIFEIKAEKPYSSDFRTCCDEAQPECRGKKQRAILPIEGLKLENYSLVFIGSPNWWGTLAPPVRTFAEKNLEELKGKKVCLFQTHGGGGMQNLGRDFAEIFGDKATVLTPKAFTGSSVRQSVEELEKFAAERAEK